MASSHTAAGHRCSLRRDKPDSDPQPFIGNDDQQEIIAIRDQIIEREAAFALYRPLLARRRALIAYRKQTAKAGPSHSCFRDRR